MTTKIEARQFKTAILTPALPRADEVRGRNWGRSEPAEKQREVHYEYYHISTGQGRRGNV